MHFWRTPLDQSRLRIPRGRVRILIDRCKGCSFCVEYCPRDVLRITEQFNQKGYHYPEVVKETECVDCNLCETICPEFAIYSETNGMQSMETDPQASPAEGTGGGS